jgi:hypothetical protein
VLFMVIERYLGNVEAIYARAGESGPLLPDGVEYIDSWVDVGMGRCFQLMSAPDAAMLALWAARWADLADLEIVPVVTSAEAAAAVRARTLPSPADDDAPFGHS